MAVFLKHMSQARLIINVCSSAFYFIQYFIRDLLNILQLSAIGAHERAQNLNMDPNCLAVSATKEKASGPIAYHLVQTVRKK